MHTSAAGLSIEPSLAPGGLRRGGAARAARAGKPRGAQRPEGGPHELGGARAAPPEPWVDTAGRPHPLAFPDLVTQGDVFAPSQASYLLEIVHRR